MLRAWLSSCRDAGAGIVDRTGRAPYCELLASTYLESDPAAIRDRVVVIRTDDQLTAAIAMVECDGIARRLLLCPPDIRRDHLAAVIQEVEADAMITNIEDAEA